MEMQEVISRAERNIRRALRDYGAHTSQTEGERIRAEILNRRKETAV